MTIDRLSTRDNFGDGLHVTDCDSDTMSVTNTTVANNGTDGVWLSDSDVALTHSTISGNQVGVRYLLGSAGELTASNVKFNHREGIALMSGSGRSPSPVVTGNNVYGNSVTESGVLASPALSAASSGTNSNDVTSGVWSTPGGEAIERIQYTYSEYERYSTNYCTGYVKKDSASGQTLISTPSARTNRYEVVSTSGVTSIVAHVVDNQSNSHGTMTINRAFYYATPVNIEIVALNDSGTVDCTDNYWGVFPDVQDRMTLTRPTSIDFQGFQIGEVSGTGPQ